MEQGFTAESEDVVEIKDGKYAGLWSGFNVFILDSDPDVWAKEFQTTLGVKGMNVKCWVYVKDKKATVEIRK